MSVTNLIEIGSSPTEQHLSNKEPDISWSKFRNNLHSATPSVIRKGLCMLRNKGKETECQTNNTSCSIQVKLCREMWKMLKVSETMCQGLL